MEVGLSPAQNPSAVEGQRQRAHNIETGLLDCFSQRGHKPAECGESGKPSFWAGMGSPREPGSFLQPNMRLNIVVLNFPKCLC